jgi:amino acid transporter
MANLPSDSKNTIGYWSVVAIGIGGMVGGGIFAVLGLAVELARGGTPIAFAIAGVVAMFTAYSYSRLSATYISRGGTVGFLTVPSVPGFSPAGLIFCSGSAMLLCCHSMPMPSAATAPAFSRRPHNLSGNMS